MTIRRLAIAILLLTVAASASAAEIRGAWTADATEKDPGKIHFQLNRKHNNNGRTFQVTSFTGLSDAQVRSASQVPVTFALRAEAGTISFEGTFKDGFGAGQFTFSPNHGFFDAVRSMGISTESKKRRSGREQDPDEALLQYAISDLSTPFIRSMQAVGYNVSLDQYHAFRIFKVTPDLVRELGSLGYENISADDLVGSQIHKVTPAYIREMRAAGFGGLSLDELVFTRIHKVTPEFAREMSDLGYGGLELEDLTSFRIHRVTAEFIKDMRELGYDKVPADKLVSMRIHRVTPEFIKELREAGYSKIPVDKLISMRIHGVDAAFAKKMNGM